jgi:hypothetical protein
LELRESRLLTTISRWVRFAWGWAVFGVPVTVVILLVMLFAPSKLPLPARLTVELGFYGPGVAATLPESAVEPGTRLALARTLYGLAVIEAPVGLIAFYQLKRILQNVADKSPFVMENANRMRILGLSIIGGAFLAFVQGMIMGPMLAGGITLPGVDLATRPAFREFYTAGIGFVVLLLAEIFRYGIRLQEEADLTV